MPVARGGNRTARCQEGDTTSQWGKLAWVAKTGEVGHRSNRRRAGGACGDTGSGAGRACCRLRRTAAAGELVSELLLGLADGSLLAGFTSWLAEPNWHSMRLSHDA